MTDSFPPTRPLQNRPAEGEAETVTLGGDLRPAPSSGSGGVTHLPPGSLPSGLDYKSVPTPTPNSKMGPYLIQRSLGRGGMGEVFLATDEGLARSAAVKVIAPSLASSDAALERLRIEARSAARLSHPNIVSVYAFGEHQGLAYIAFEYIQGTDLHAYIDKQGAMKPADALRAIKQAAVALRYASEQKILHRDIKPSNLLILHDGTVKVADFGLAKQLDSDNSLTATAAVLGTPNYMSPEQGLGEELDFRSDIYSLGCTLYTLLTCELPYKASTPVATIIKHSQDPIPVPESMRGIANGRLIVLMQRMMAKKRADRHQSYDELIVEIDTLLPQLGSVSPVKSGGNKKLLVGVFSLVGVGLLAGAAIVLVNREKPAGSTSTAVVSPSAGAPAIAAEQSRPSPNPSPLPTAVPPPPTDLSGQQQPAGAEFQPPASMVYDALRGRQSQDARAIADMVQGLDWKGAYDGTVRMVNDANTDPDERIAMKLNQENLELLAKVERKLQKALDDGAVIQIQTAGGPRKVTGIRSGMLEYQGSDSTSTTQAAISSLSPMVMGSMLMEFEKAIGVDPDDMLAIALYRTVGARIRGPLPIRELLERTTDPARGESIRNHADAWGWLLNPDGSGLPEPGDRRGPPQFGQGQRPGGPNQGGRPQQ